MTEAVEKEGKGEVAKIDAVERTGAFGGKEGFWKKEAVEKKATGEKNEAVEEKEPSRAEKPAGWRKPSRRKKPPMGRNKARRRKQPPARRHFPPGGTPR